MGKIINDAVSSYFLHHHSLFYVVPETKRNEQSQRGSHGN